jgi:hypothetical protein
MKKIEMFQAKDGRNFDNRRDCLQYEKTIDRLTVIFNQLSPLPNDDDCRFSNGHGFIQHDRNVYNKVVSEFYSAACLFHTGLGKFAYNSYGFWRTLDDTNSLFYRFGFRLLNIDETTMREYGQPYYKNNPDKITGGCLN